jgi:hypothetical protein
MDGRRLPRYGSGQWRFKRTGQKSLSTPFRAGPTGCTASGREAGGTKPFRREAGGTKPFLRMVPRSSGMTHGQIRRPHCRAPTGCDPQRNTQALPSCSQPWSEYGRSAEPPIFPAYWATPLERGPLTQVAPEAPCPRKADGRRSNSTGGSVSKRLTVDCHLGTVGIEAQHPSHFGGLSRRRLVAPHDAVMDLSLDIERPI